jgi:hypothetical protein
MSRWSILLLLIEIGVLVFGPDDHGLSGIAVMILRKAGFRVAIRMVGLRR